MNLDMFQEAIPFLPDEDVRPEPPRLRYYQEEAHEAVETAWLLSRSCLVVMATGLGKTQVLSSIAGVAEGRVLVLAHRSELVDQAARRLEQMTGEPIGIEQAQFRSGRERIVVGSVQTVYRDNRLERLRRNGGFQTVIVDEAHHYVARTYKKAVEAWPEANILGVTATPDRGDEKALGLLFDEVAFEMDIIDGVEAGYLAPLEGRREFLEEVDISGVDTNAGDLVAAQLDEEMLKATEGIVDVMLTKYGDRRGVAFFPGKRSANYACERLNLRSPGCAVVITDDTDPMDRKEIIRAIHRGEVQFLANCFDEETEILTLTGWRKGTDLADHELVATFNMGSEELEWQPAKAPFSRPVGEGERMVHIKNQSLDIRVTEGHRMVVRTAGAKEWKVVEAKGLVDAISPYEIPISAPRVDMDVQPMAPWQAEFLGLFESDGHMSKMQQVEISQSQESPNGPFVTEEIERILTACGFDWSSEERVVTSGFAPEGGRLTRRFRIPKGNIGGQLKRVGWSSLGCAVRKGCDIVPLLSDENFERFLYGMWLGDGYKRERLGRKRKLSYTICTASQKVADLLQAQGVQRGWAVSLSAFPNGDGEIHVVRLRRRKTIRTNNKHVQTSGGNPARFVEPRPWERVWCCSTANTTVIVRRNGRVAIAGQCMIATEGFDWPQADAIFNARPTKSRSLYAQIAGRGTRVLPGVVDSIHGREGAAARRAAIATSDKPSCYLVDFVGNSGKHSLIGPEDILGGRFTEDEVKKAKELAEKEEGGDPMQHLREAQRALKALAAKAKAQVKSRSEAFDPFSLFGSEYDDSQDRRYGSTPATAKQIAALEKMGVKDAAKLSKRAATQMFKVAATRRKYGLSTFKQQKILRQYGITKTNVTFQQASDAISYISHTGWGRREKIDPERLRSIVDG